jgi:hypothetical protein
MFTFSIESFDPSLLEDFACCGVGLYSKKKIFYAYSNTFFLKNEEIYEILEAGLFERFRLFDCVTLGSSFLEIRESLEATPTPKFCPSVSPTSILSSVIDKPALKILLIY